MLLEYLIEAEIDGGEVRIEWDDTPRHIVQYKETLDVATAITLLPRAGVALPTVRVRYDVYKRWVVFHKKIAGFQFYAIGWQTTVRGLNVKAINWVHPDGSVEMTLEPTFRSIQQNGLR